MRLLPFCAAALLVTTELARSQCFNIDTGIIGSPPSTAYGAASGMSGFWNDVGATPLAAALNDLNGVPTCVTITATTVFGVGAGAAGALIPLTQPDDAALYNDFALVPGGATTTWTISGIAPATYDVYVYSVSSIAATNPTLLSCITPPSGKLLSGTWNGVGTAPIGAAYVTDLGVVTVPPACGLGTITFTSSVFGLNPYGCVNGIQIVQQGGGCPAVYCTPGTSGSGCIPVLSFGGPNPPSASVWPNGFVITASLLDGQKAGIFFYSISGPKAAPWCGVAGSYLCIKAPAQRTSVSNTGGTAGACDGIMSMDWNVYTNTHTGELGDTPWLAGDDVWIQAWYRDPIAPCSNVTSNMTEALHFVQEP